MNTLLQVRPVFTLNPFPDTRYKTNERPQIGLNIHNLNNQNKSQIYRKTPIYRGIFGFLSPKLRDINKQTTTIFNL